MGKNKLTVGDKPRALRDRSLVSNFFKIFLSNLSWKRIVSTKKHTLDRSTRNINLLKLLF